MNFCGNGLVQGKPNPKKLILSWSTLERKKKMQGEIKMSRRYE